MISVAMGSLLNKLIELNQRDVDFDVDFRKKIDQPRQIVVSEINRI